MISEKIRSYWNDRAKESGGAANATTNDIHLRELEIATTVDTIRELCKDKTDVGVLDVGCGDGFSTLRIAAEIENSTFLGVDYSESMIENAKNNLEAFPDLKQRVEFSIGDATKIGDACGDRRFDVVLSFRCLINLQNFEDQANAIREIYKCVEPGGYYLAIENFIEGNDALNAARAKFDLPEIAVRWHNLFFTEPDFTKAATDAGFEVVRIRDFSSAYYLATRVVYSAMCKMKGEDPDYDHEIHRLSVNLPETGQFSPIRMAVLRKK
jgi:ubiquinone/menaquinone biosynthesis C-methylase UbiE